MATELQTLVRRAVALEQTWVVAVASTSTDRASICSKQLCVVQSHYQGSDISAAQAMVTTGAEQRR